MAARTGRRTCPCIANVRLRYMRIGYSGRSGRTAAQDAAADIAILDTVQHAAVAALAAARVSDFVLIPCCPATADLVAIGASIDLIRIADTPGVVVINAAPIANPPGA